MELPFVRNVPLLYALATLAATATIVAAQLHGFALVRRLPLYRSSLSFRRLSWAGFALALSLAAASDLLGVGKLVAVLFPGAGFPTWWRFCSSVWVAGSFVTYVSWAAVKAVQKLRTRPSADHGVESGIPEAGSSALGRRELMRQAARAAMAVPFAVAGYGTFIGRTNFELREIDIDVPNLPPDLEGLRLAQLTDIHAGPYMTPTEVQRAVDMANEAKPHLALVTGDLITTRHDPLDRCLKVLSGLKADAGIYACMGNHERYAKAESFAAERGRSLEMEFLRGDSRMLRFGQAKLNLSGVDYQRKNSVYLSGAAELVEPDCFNLLLSHNPDVFPVAEELGYDLVMSGHTHGGQVTVEIVEQWANAGRFYTPYVAGPYRRKACRLYVSRGIGTVNLPMRVGALPEITVLRLRRA